jgi:4-amino-4-deoxy-L-arabinose transferase-like glycosyltransferase
MRSRLLQALYLQKPVTWMVVGAALTVLPWIGLGEFATKGEPREAAVAVSMLASGDYILPRVYAEEFAYKPPLVHWLMVAASYGQGYVSECTSRLPSALGLVLLVWMVVMFYGRRVGKLREAMLTGCILATCVEIHRAGMTARVDMVLTVCMVWGMLGMYRWGERGMKGLPLWVCLVLGLGCLAKGPVGIVLPLLVWGVYKLVEGERRFREVCRGVLYVGVGSVFVPALWYASAYASGGEEFRAVMLAENLGRFFRVETGGVGYALGHEQGWWYNFLTVAGGLVPWTLVWIWVVPWRKVWGSVRRGVKGVVGVRRVMRRGAVVRRYAVVRGRGILGWLRGLEKVELYSVVGVVVIMLFYTIPSSKRSVYLMPAYPFMAYLLAQYLLGKLRGKRVKVVYWTVGVMCCLNMVIDGVVMREYRRVHSIKGFAERIREEYGLERGNVYVMNDLRKYPNLYGLNFYLGNIFRKFGAEGVERGYLLCGEGDLDRIRGEWGGYEFAVLEGTEEEHKEIGQRVLLVQFER